MVDLAVLIWSIFINKCGYKEVHIIAHQQGKECLAAIQSKFGDEFFKNIGKIALTSQNVIQID